MIKSFFIVFLWCAFLLIPCYAADTLTAGSPMRIASADEDLMLDDGPSSVLPLENKKPVLSNTVDSSATTKNADVSTPGTAPVRPADTTTAKQTPSAPQEKGAVAPGDTTSSRTAAAKAADTGKKIIDEDLILDGGEEDLLSQEKKTAIKNAGASIGKVPDSSAARQGPSSASESVDSASGQAGSVAPEEKSGLNESSETTPSAPVVAAKIENARSINFAANLKEYRSPKLAMLMSFVVPGSGQVYAKSGLWAAGFLAVEAVIVGTGLIYSSKSKTKKADARKFADTMYSAEKFETYTGDLKTNLSGLPNGDTIYSSYFFDSGDVHFLNEAKKNPANRSNQFYDDIAREESPFVRGWNDVSPEFSGGRFVLADTSVYHVYPGKDSSYYVYRYGNKGDYRFGFSDNQVSYIGMLDESRKLANISKNAFYSLLINHLASAVMAGIEAKNHNDALLGKETVWKHINIEQQYVNTGSETVAGYSVGVRF